MGKRLGVGLVAAVLAGALLGAAARVCMTLVSLAAGSTPSFSWTGSSFILIIFVVVMIPGGLVAGLTARRLRWLLPVAGALFLCVPAISVARAEVGDTAGWSAAQWIGVAAAGLSVFLMVALLPLLTVRLTDRWLGRRSPRAPAVAVAGS